MINYDSDHEEFYEEHSKEEGSNEQRRGVPTPTNKVWNSNNSKIIEDFSWRRSMTISEERLWLLELEENKKELDRLLSSSKQ